MTRRIGLCVPFALCASGLLALVLTGCSREAEAPSPLPSVPSNSPAAYMNDPAFMARLDAQRDELKAIMKERAPLIARWKKLEVNDPERDELTKKIEELNAKCEAVRKRQLEILHERISK